jgi:protein-export membrane protein SecD/preprotein translocase SecF subunit
MSGRATKWVVVVFLPLLLALYLSYPPDGIQKRIVRRTQVCDGRGVWVDVKTVVRESRFTLPTLARMEDLPPVLVGDLKDSLSFIETADARYRVIGVGINVDDSDEKSEEKPQSATLILRESVRAFDLQAALDLVTGDDAGPIAAGNAATGAWLYGPRDDLERFMEEFPEAEAAAVETPDEEEPLGAAIKLGGDEDNHIDLLFLREKTGETPLGLFVRFTARVREVVLEEKLHGELGYPDLTVGEARNSFTLNGDEAALSAFIKDYQPTREVDVTTIIHSSIKKGLDIDGGAELLYRLSPTTGQTLAGGELSRSIDILKKRIDPTNVKEFRIQAIGEDRILIAVPGATPAEIARLKTRLARMGELQFRLIPPTAGNSDLYQKARDGASFEGTDYVRELAEDGSYLPVMTMKAMRRDGIALTGRSLSWTGRSTDDRGLPAVGFRFSPIAAGKFADLTESHKNWRLAIILDGELKSAPQINKAIRGGSGIITGGFTQSEVDDMVNVLRAGSLPMDIELLQESTVGPQLGRDSIRSGLLALAVAGMLVLIFIGVYYMFCGLVADGALILNLVLLMGAMSLLGATLTLPGMAGILLTIGMAVDANVLIFERIREELAAGKNIRVALRNGYDRAFTTIVDANVTTLLTAMILYLVGTGPIKGFAVTLSVGLLISMFTALVVTRLVFETFIEKGWMKSFRMRAVVQGTKIPFSAMRKSAYAISAVVVLVGLVAFIGRGAALYDIDFTGGDMVQISLEEPQPIDEVRTALKARYPNAEVQGLGQSQDGAYTGFSIRIKGTGTEGVMATLSQKLALGQDDSIAAVGSGRIEIVFAEATTEPALRKRLADAELLIEIDSVRPTDRVIVDNLEQEVVADNFIIREDAAEAGPAYWRSVINAVRAGLATPDGAFVHKNVSIRDCKKVDGAVELTLADPVAANLLGVEMWRLDYRNIEVADAGEAGKYRLTGQADELDEFVALKAPRELKEELRVKDGDDTVTCTVTSCTKTDDGVELLLDKAVASADLAEALENAGLPHDVVETEEPAKKHLVAAETTSALLAQLAPRTLYREIAEIPDVVLDGLDVHVNLRAPSNERTVRTQLQRYGLRNITIVSPGLESRRFQLALSANAVRAAIADIFGEKARRTVNAEFAPGETPDQLIMTLTEKPMTLERLRDFVEAASLGIEPDELIVGADEMLPSQARMEWTLQPGEDKALEVQQGLQAVFKDPVGRISQIGAAVAEELKARALLAILFASAIIVLYVAVRFHAFRFGVAAVIALLHDVLITAGLIALADWSGIFGDVKIGLATLAAFLTIIGYSLNDTIVVFDRIRENMAKLGRGKVDAEIIDLSINQTLSRTLLTSLTTLSVVVVLYLMGGAVLQGLALTLIIGVAVGTYSSMFVASPLLLDWQQVAHGTNVFFRIVFLPITLPVKLLSGSKV